MPNLKKSTYPKGIHPTLVDGIPRRKGSIRKQTNKPKAMKIKLGRPRGIGEDFMPIFTTLVRKGFTKEELAEAFQVSRNTIATYLGDPDFLESLEKAGEKANGRVREALYKRALGYTYPVEKFVTTKTGRVKKVVTMEHVPPDLQAAKTWLVNKDRENFGHSADGVQVNQTNITQVTNVKREFTQDDRSRLQANVELARRHGLYDFSSSQG